MPVIAFCSPKGGAGKTTAATVLATELAQRGPINDVLIRVGIDDGDRGAALDKLAAQDDGASGFSASAFGRRENDDRHMRWPPPLNQYPGSLLAPSG